MSFCDKKVSMCHIVYIALICAIFCLFVILICPGKISEEAYTNFSFAATITSIVLAVVSIVYSLQSGLSSVGQLNSIKDVEVSIKNELQKFSDIEGAIKKVIDPIEKSMGEIKQTTTDIKNQTGEISKKMSEEVLWGKQQSESTSEGRESNSAENANWPSMFYLIFYMCQQSYKKGKILPYSIFVSYFKKEYWFYCLGVIKGIAIFKPEALKIEVVSNRELKILEYKESEFGEDSLLREKIRKINKELLEELDDYYK